MNDIGKTLDNVGDKLEAFGDKAEEVASEIGDTIAEEAREQSWMTWMLWASLIIVAVWAGWQGLWRAMFVAVVTLLLTLLPLMIQRWADFRLPRLLIFLIAAFAALTLVAGEVFDFYEKFWWWDVAMHSGSAVMFGIFGVILVMLVFDNASIKASPGMVAFFAFCFALAVGAVWEIFEFAMDSWFGLNMQKSGLVDTMWDLIVDSVGAFIGAATGYAYLKFGRKGMVGQILHDVVEENRHKFEDKSAATLPGEA